MGWETSLPCHWPMTIQEGWQAITQAVMNHCIKVRGPGHPCVNLLTQQPFRFDLPRGSPIKDTPRDGSSDHQPLPCQPPRGQDHNWCQRDQRLPPPWLPSPSPDCGFESDRSLLSMASSMSDRLEGSQHSWWGRWHWEDRAHMKINLPVFKEEDAKDVVTYQSWRWDLTVYWHVGCRDCTSPAICYSVFARLPWWVSTELQYGYNFGWHFNNLRWTL